MSMEFGKLNFAVGFNRTSAFPLDANSYFESYADAVNAAKGAAEVGSSDSAYYIGQLLIVKDSTEGVGLYQINAGKTLTKFGQASSADELASKVSALETRCTTIEGKLILATTEADGLMSKEDKAKLDGVEAKITAETERATGAEKTNSDNIAALDGRVTTAEGKIKTNADNITALQGKLSGLTGAMHFVGTSTTDPTSETGATIDGVTSFNSGDVCLFGKKEFVYSVTGETGSWIELGDEGSHLTKEEASTLYATKDSVTSDITTAKTELTTDYDTKLGNKVDKVEGKSLVSDTLITKLEGIDTSSALIKTIGAGLVLSEEKELSVDVSTIPAIAIEKVTGLQDALDAKQTAEQVSSAIAAAKIKASQIDGSVASAATADKVANALTIGTKTYNGSEAIEITAADLGALVNVPQATEEVLGGIKLGHVAGANEAAVKLDEDGKAYVTVPAAATYTAGSGLTLSANEFSIADGAITNAMLAGEITSDKIASLNVQKLEQTEGEFLVLDGGDAQ